MPIMDENDVSLPKATLSKMIREFMPSEVRLAGEAMDMIIECCTEFVSLVSSESNDVSGRENRNTIHPEHVIKALQELGLQEFVEEVTAAWDAWKEESKCRPTGAHKTGNRKTPADAAGLSEEEQIALQQQLFAAARKSFQVPDPSIEARVHSNIVAPVNGNTGCANLLPAPVSGPHLELHQGLHGNQGHLTHQAGSFHTTDGGISCVPNLYGQQPQLGVYQQQPLAYGNPSSHITTGFLQKHGAAVDSSVVKGSGHVASDPRSPISTPSMSGYGSDVLPIPPLMAQPMPSAFHPSSNPCLSGPSLGVSPSQNCAVNQGTSPAGIALNAQQCMLLVQPPVIGSQAITPMGSGSQGLWTTGVLPEIQLSQPVVVIHNGVQHVVSLQTLLSQVGGLQEFRSETSPTSMQVSGVASKDGRHSILESQILQVGSEPQYSKREEPLHTQADVGLGANAQPIISPKCGKMQMGTTVVLHTPDATKLSQPQFAGAPSAPALPGSIGTSMSPTSASPDQLKFKEEDVCGGAEGDAQVDPRAAPQASKPPALTTMASVLETTILPVTDSSSSPSPGPSVLQTIPIVQQPVRQESSGDHPVLEQQLNRYNSLHVPISSGLEPTLDGRNTDNNTAHNQASQPVVSGQCENADYCQSSPQLNHGNSGLSGENSGALKRSHSDGPGGDSGKIDPVETEPSPLRRKTQMSQEMLCEPT